MRSGAAGLHFSARTQTIRVPQGDAGSRRSSPASVFGQGAGSLQHESPGAQVLAAPAPPHALPSVAEPWTTGGGAVVPTGLPGDVGGSSGSRPRCGSAGESPRTLGRVRRLVSSDGTAPLEAALAGSDAATGLDVDSACPASNAASIFNPAVAESAVGTVGSVAPWQPAPATAMRKRTERCVNDSCVFFTAA